MTYCFHGKRALVTGGGQGIGRAICIQLSKCGASVVALSRTQKNLDSLKEEIPGLQVICVDLTDWNATRKAVECCGPIQLLVNNAGTNVPKHFLDATPEDIDNLMELNFKSMINVSQVVTKGLIARKEEGSIVNVSSLASKLAFEGHTVYSGSKAAVDMASKVMAMELGPHKIRVNCVNPTVVWTELAQAYWSKAKVSPLVERTPLGRVAEMDDVVNAVLFLLSDGSKYINGINLPIEGGLLTVGTQVPKCENTMC